MTRKSPLVPIPGHSAFLPAVAVAVAQETADTFARVARLNGIPIEAAIRHVLDAHAAGAAAWLRAAGLDDDRPGGSDDYGPWLD
jgi:hypothetical protein